MDRPADRTQPRATWAGKRTWHPTNPLTVMKRGRLIGALASTSRLSFVVPLRYWDKTDNSKVGGHFSVIVDCYHAQQPTSVCSQDGRSPCARCIRSRKSGRKCCFAIHGRTIHHRIAITRLNLSSWLRWQSTRASTELHTMPLMTTTPKPRTWLSPELDRRA